MNAKAKSSSGVPPLDPKAQSRDGSATLPAPTGRKKLAQGKERSDAALGHDSQNTSRPERAKEYILGNLLLPRREKAIPAEHPDLPYIGLEHVEAQTTKLLGSVSATEMRSTANRFYSGDVLYSRLRPYLNKVWRADRDGLCSSEFIVLPGNDSVDSGFLRYRLNAADFVSFANSLNAGDRPRVDFHQISAFCLPPFSLPTQRRIVAEIEKQFTRLEAGVAALRRVQANLKRYRAAVLKAACEAHLVPTEGERLKAEGRSLKDFESGEQLLKRILAERRKNWTGRGKCKEPAALDTTNLPPLPEGWTWATFDHVVDRMRNGTTANQNTDGVGTPVSRIETIWDSKIDWERVRHITNPSPELVEEYKLLPGDLLFSHINSDTHLGKTALYTDSMELLLHGMNLMLLRPDKGAILPAYLHYVCMHYRFAGEFIRIAQHAVNQSSINQTKLKLVVLRLPPPAEQTRIVAEVERRLSVVEELESVVSANLQRATRLRQSILQQAFTGKLVVDA